MNCLVSYKNKFAHVTVEMLYLGFISCLGHLNHNKSRKMLFHGRSGSPNNGFHDGGLAIPRWGAGLIDGELLCDGYEAHSRMRSLDLHSTFQCCTWDVSIIELWCCIVYQVDLQCCFCYKKMLHVKVFNVSRICDWLTEIFVYWFFMLNICLWYVAVVKLWRFACWFEMLQKVY